MKFENTTIFIEEITLKIASVKIAAILSLPIVWGTTKQSETCGIYHNRASYWLLVNNAFGGWFYSSDKYDRMVLVNLSASPSKLDQIQMSMCWADSSLAPRQCETSLQCNAVSHWLGAKLESLSGVPDFFDRNKILSGGDLSHYQMPHCIRVFFYFVWFVFIHHNFQFYFEICTYCNILDIFLS